MKKKEKKYEKPNSKWKLFLSRSLKQQKYLKRRILKIKKIIEMRYNNKMKLSEIGKEIGMTKEGVRQILKKFKL